MHIACQVLVGSWQISSLRVAYFINGSTTQFKIGWYYRNEVETFKAGAYVEEVTHLIYDLQR